MTPYVPGVVELRVQEPAPVPFAVRLTGDPHVTVRPIVGLIVGDRVTVPAKLFELVSITLRDGAVAPELKFTEAGDTEMLKSPT